MNLNYFRLCALRVAALVAIATTSPVFATAMFDASASAILEVSNINNDQVLVTGSATVATEWENTTGNAVANADTTVMFLSNGTSGPSLLAEADGTAEPTAPPGSSSLAQAFTNGLLTIENNSPETVVLDLMLTYAVEAFGSITAFDGSEFVNAFALVSLGGAEEFFIQADASPDEGDFGEAISGTLPFQLTLTPTSSAQYTLFVDAGEQADSVGVPAPGTLLLLVIGLVGTGVVGRRMRG